MSSFRKKFLFLREKLSDYFLLLPGEECWQVYKHLCSSWNAKIACELVETEPGALFVNCSYVRKGALKVVILSTAFLNI